MSVPDAGCYTGTTRAGRTLVLRVDIQLDLLAWKLGLCLDNGRSITIMKHLLLAREIIDMVGEQFIVWFKPLFVC